MDLIGPSTREIKAKVALRAFCRLTENHWNLTRRDQIKLLGVRERTFYSWLRRLEQAKLMHDTLERISHLIGIYSMLHQIFGEVEKRGTQVGLGALGWLFMKTGMPTTRIPAL